MVEDDGTKRKRLAMRSWRRGMREMDLILGPWADAHLAGMADGALTLFDSLLDENDQDLLPWVLGQRTPPERFANLLDRIGGFSRGRFGQGPA